MNGHAGLLADGSEFVHWLADDVDDAAQRLFAHRNANGASEVDGLHTADHSVSGFHGDGAYAAFAEMLLDLKDYRDGRGDCEAVADNTQRLIDGRHGGFFELN